MNTQATLKALAVSLTLLGYGAGALAAETLGQGIKRRAPQGITTKLYACVDKADASGGTSAIAACLSAEKTAQDDRLDSTYKALLGKLNGKAKDALVGSEQAWLNFHEKTGTFEDTVYGKAVADDLQRLESEVFRLSERANALDKYLAIAKAQ
ncbi:lysozyme inhibitor LprI family protein [Ralstonia sp. 24A2]|uniref:lysozyme inhibitor LprI family protein n=1 Tax=Ralstonia sp. 24A2 TaxID=3447364 RepID=UPI003F698360